MKKINFLLLFAIAAMAVSCSSDPSLGKNDALEYIVDDLGGNSSRSTTIPTGIKSQSRIDDSSMMEYRAYERAGLLTIQDTTYTYRSTNWSNYGKMVTVNSVYIQPTEKAAAAIVDVGDKSITVLLYKYEYNKIDDIELVMKKPIENFDGEYHVYTVFYEGNIIEATPFANAIGISLNDKYPFSTTSEDALGVMVLTAVYRNGELVTLLGADKDVTTDSKKEEYYDEVWFKMAKSAINER